MGKGKFTVYPCLLFLPPTSRKNGHLCRRFSRTFSESMGPRESHPVLRKKNFIELECKIKRGCADFFLTFFFGIPVSSTTQHHAVSQGTHDIAICRWRCNEFLPWSARRLDHTWPTKMLGAGIIYSNLPSGNWLHSYWTWPIEIVDLPIKDCDLPKSLSTI